MKHLRRLLHKIQAHHYQRRAERSLRELHRAFILEHARIQSDLAMRDWHTERSLPTLRH